MGNVLRLIRDELDCKQEDLAKRFDISVQTISHYENGRRPPSANYLQGLATLAGITVDKIYDMATGKTINGFTSRRSLRNKSSVFASAYTTDSQTTLVKAMNLLEKGLITSEKFDMILKLIAEDQTKEKESSNEQ